VTCRSKQGASGRYEAFARWYEEYLPRVLNYMRLRVEGEALAQDLTALTFERALSRLPMLRDEAAFGGWLFSIARTVVAGYYRHMQPVVSLESAPDCPDPEPSVEGQVVQTEELAMLAAALAGLTERERDIIRLRFAAGLSNRAVAQAMGIRESHAAVILYRALRKVRRELAQDSTERTTGE
jgi:RNA polymerase sigma factor (sigma-70 family)